MTEIVTLERLREYVTDCVDEITDSDDIDTAIHETADGSEYVIYPRHHFALLDAAEDMGVNLDGIYEELIGDSLAKTWGNVLTVMAYGALAELLRTEVAEARRAGYTLLGLSPA